MPQRVRHSSKSLAAFVITTAVLLGLVVDPTIASAAITGGDWGYRVAVADGTVRTFGTTRAVAQPQVPTTGWGVVGIAATPSGRGYWLVAADGGVFTYGDARFYGSAAGSRLAHPIVGVAATPSGRGYWLVAADGGVFTYGDARFYGSAARTRLPQRIAGIESTPSGRGYWLVAADGGVFTYGDARFYGSAARTRLPNPIVAIAKTPSGRGYWLVGSDGGVFTYGDAQFRGSGARVPLNEPIVGMESTPSGRGYWLVASDGGVFAYGDAHFHGSAVEQVRGHNPYRKSATGYDISWPQCGAPLPTTSHEVTVIGVNDGHMMSRNPCLAGQAKWAGKTLSLYVNVDGLPNDATSGLTGPRGRCATGDLDCRSYNYGWKSVAYDLAYTNGLGIKSKTWWLDVEVEPIWRTDNARSNANVIKGVLEGLRAHGFTVGIYSTKYQWGVITGGGYTPRAPIWVPGASTFAEAQAHCSPHYAFGGGTTWLTQWTTDFDHAYAC